jgi:subtilisin family serine protease
VIQHGEMHIGDEQTSVLVELAASRPNAFSAAAGSTATSANRAMQRIRGRFNVDLSFGAVPLSARSGVGPMAMHASLPETEVIRVMLANDADYQQLKSTPGVVAVWTDPHVAPFPGVDCNSQTTSTTSAHVADALGATRIWGELGLNGAGVTIGIVDGGVDASLLPPGKVTGGWSPLPANPPGSSPVAWGGHGDMCAFDALVASPDASIHDYAIGRISGGVPVLVSAALRAFEAARISFVAGNGPDILSNSWGVYQQAWDPAPVGSPSNYTHNANHPFNRKVIEVIDAGILVCFAAGNCGEVCPDGRCAGDIGPGRSIRGANGLPRVISVGAANVLKAWIGYSSQGPSTMDIEKPDVCGYSHFIGRTACDSGTSSACPIVAGVLGLMRQVSPTLRQDQARGILRNTAQHPDGKHWDGRYGRGIVDAYSAVRGL